MRTKIDQKRIARHQRTASGFDLFLSRRWINTARFPLARILAVLIQDWDQTARRDFCIGK